MMIPKGADVERVHNLIENWMSDNCWDLEDTEGFEEYREYLLRQRLAIQERWKQERDDHIHDRAAELGCSFNTAEYVLGLERNLEIMDERIRKLEEN